MHSALKTVFKSSIDTDSYDHYSEDEESLGSDTKDSYESSNNIIYDDDDDVCENDYELSALEAIASAIVLEEAVNELGIIERMGNLPRVEVNLNYITIAQRFKNDLGDTHIYDPETIVPYQEAMNKQKFVKFQTDRSFAETILKATIHDLTTYYNYKSLVKYLNQHKKTFNEEKQLLEDELKSKIELFDIKDQLQRERRQTLVAIQAYSETIGQLRDEFEDIIFENKYKMNYIKNWENARIEQNNYRLDKQEECYINAIRNDKTNIERETRITAEIGNFIVEIQKEYQEGILFWMEKYDKEIEIRDTEIQVLKERREDQFNSLHEVSQLYDAHKKEIEEFLVVKEIRRQEEELLQYQIKAATKIQAWWRGVMVRKCLGAYSKKKKKGKNSEKKKGKK